MRMAYTRGELRIIHSGLKVSCNLSNYFVTTFIIANFPMVYNNTPLVLCTVVITEIDNNHESSFNIS